jgi:hypothetical protein
VATNLLRRAALALVVGLAGVAAGGCGGPPKADVHGTVTLDGKPIADGLIEFFPVSGAGQPGAAPIKDGKYQLTVSPGEMKVSVYATEVIGKQKMYDTPDSPWEDKVRNLIPEKYNTQSELKASVKAGPNEANFDLTGNAKKK